MTIAVNYYLSGWYIAVSLILIGYCIFNVTMFGRYRRATSVYSAIIFGSIALGTTSVALIRMGVFPDFQWWWFNVQRSSYIGVIVGGWFWIDYRLLELNGPAANLRQRWRFWRLLGIGK